MKKFILASVFLFSIICTLQVKAQYCGGSGSSVCSTANSPLTAEGFYPDQNDLPCVVDGIPYDTVIQIRTPATVSSGGSSYTLSYITITSITNLPCGLCWALGDPNNRINGNADGCMRVKGTSFDAPGQFLLNIIVDATVSVGPFPVTETGQNLSSQGLKFFARVKVPNGACDTVNTASNGNTAAVAGNISIPSISGATSVCSGGNATLTVGGGTYYGYSWSNGATTSSINVTSSGTYNVTVYENCTSATASKTITVSPAPTVTINPATTTICSGTPTTLTATGGGTYSWSNATSGAAITVSPTVTTAYTVTVTSANNCTATATRTLTVNPAPSVSVTPLTDTVCQGTSTTLTAVGTGNFTWSNAGSTNAITVTPSATTTYTVTITNGSSCTASATRTVVVNSVGASISATGPVTFCSGGSVSLVVDSTYASYTWSTGATTSSITVNQAGSYTATVTKNGCTGVSNSIAVSVGSNLSPTITANPSLNICPGGHVTLDAGQGYTTYSWSGGAGTHETAVISTGGTYTVSVASGTCAGTAQVTVVVGNFPLAVSITPTGPISLCAGDSVTLNAGSGFASYEWSNGAQIATVVANATAAYAVTVTKNACIGVDTVHVTVNALPAPVITPAGPLARCDGDAVTLDAGAGFSAYSWSDGETTETVQPTASGNYTVTATQHGCNGAAAAGVSVTFSAVPNPAITPAGNVSVCTGQTGALLDAGAGYSAYAWSNGATTQTTTATTAGAYTVSVTQNGCTGVTSPTTVAFVTSPVAAISAPINNSGSTYLSATPTGASYQWLVQSSPNGSYTVTNNTGANDTVSCSASAAYYSVIVTQTGCTDTSAKQEVVCTGINEIAALMNFTMHPNPATDMLYVNYELSDNSNIKLAVIDLTGRVVLDILNTTESKGAYHQQVKLNGMSAGIYLLNFVTESGSFNAKFIKQ